ncbi:MAG: DUF1232 domain-containing protein [Lautropia sp.]|nr:DUF1232 domain-containing protein [Lautropia sp.]
MFWLMRIRRLFRATGREAVMLWYALRNPATPLGIKAAIVAMAVYLFSPLDIVPDFAVLLGLVDDLAVLMIGIPFLVKRLPTEVQIDAADRADRSWLGGWLRRPGNSMH